MSSKNNGVYYVQDRPGSKSVFMMVGGHLIAGKVTKSIEPASIPLIRQGYCPAGHPLAFYLRPYHGQISCNNCADMITGSYASCRICDFDVCCIPIQSVSFNYREKCPQGHLMGFCPRGNSRYICTYCRRKLTEKHWSCRSEKCDHDVCESCLDKRKRLYMVIL